MLSYRHAFHAGNYADVLKHLVLCRSLAYLTQKAAPLCYIDTHAGAGAYDLGSEQARKTGEFHKGIELIWQRDDLPPPVAAYRDLVARFNPTGELNKYPGSPWLAQQLLREQDRLELCELHTTEYPLLQQQFADDRRVHCYHEDGFYKSVALTPPREKRGLVLIDPAYEVKDDYRLVVKHIKLLHKRFATGVYAIWYPIVDQYRLGELETGFANSGIARIDQYEISLAADHRQPGMTGAGLFVINPPWNLRQEMQQALSFLAPLVSTDGKPHFRVNELTGES